MSRGRPKKPIHLKRLQGTYRDDRDFGTMNPEVVNAVEIPSSLEFEKARGLWKKLSLQFINMGMLSELDLPLLELLCMEYQRYLKYEELIKKKGHVVILRNKSGHEYPKENPYLKLRETALNRFISLGSKFGLTPADRSKIIIGEKEKDKDMMHEYLNKKIG